MSTCSSDVKSFDLDTQVVPATIPQNYISVRACSNMGMRPGTVRQTDTRHGAAVTVNQDCGNRAMDTAMRGNMGRALVYPRSWAALALLSAV